MSTPIKNGSFTDLDVYKRSFLASKEVIFRIIPQLPQQEKFDLADQMRRSSKSVPALIAEGYAKKFQPKGFQRYLIDAMGESNEMIVHLSFAKEYLPKDEKIRILIEEYNIIGKQLYRLRESWNRPK